MVRRPNRGEPPSLLTLSHRDRSLKFYPDVLGLTAAHKSPRCLGGFRSRLLTAPRRLHFGRFALLVVLAVRVRGLWLIEEHFPHHPSRKRNEVWVLHERPDPAMRAGRQAYNSVGRGEQPALLVRRDVLAHEAEPSRAPNHLPSRHDDGAVTAELHEVDLVCAGTEQNEVRDPEVEHRRPPHPSSYLLVNVSAPSGRSSAAPWRQCR